MRLLTVLLLIAVFGILALFLKPILQPETVRGPRPETFSISRTQSVTTGKGAALPSEDSTPGPEAQPGPAAKPAGPMCDSEFDEAEARSLALPAGEAIREGPYRGSAGWTWVNVWAVWCKPCKEEMPLLSTWAAALRKRSVGLRVLFLSVDDDERQLSRFMKSDGNGLEGDFLWVREEDARTRFYGRLGVEESPTLPVHALLDPKGRLRCVRVGSVTGEDLERFEKRFRF